MTKEDQSIIFISAGNQRIRISTKKALGVLQQKNTQGFFELGQGRGTAPRMTIPMVLVNMLINPLIIFQEYINLRYNPCFILNYARRGIHAIITLAIVPKQI
ncbi:MAG: hypothetical protein K1W21_12595 [Oscillospiraceae bacterium]